MIRQRYECSDGSLHDDIKEAKLKQLEINYTLKIRGISRNVGMYADTILDNALQFTELLNCYINDRNNIEKICKDWPQ